MKLVAALAILVVSAPAAADDDPATRTIIFARDGSLVKADALGKNEQVLVPVTGTVRTLRTDAKAKVLLVEAGDDPATATWSWMPLDGRADALRPLPCAPGPAQLATDGACVFCASATKADASVIFNLATGREFFVKVPAPGTRLVGSGAKRRLVWSGTTGVWSAPPGAPANKTKVAPEPPLRGFLPSPDGTRAVGVYADVVHVGKETKPADVMMSFALDGRGARRKTIKDSIAIEWSHDGAWLLVQDGKSACIARATGGQYKCWKNYTASSIAPDGAYALIVGPSGLYRATLAGAFTTSPAIVGRGATAGVFVP